MKKRDCTFCSAKTKALISCAVTAQLICRFVFAYAKSRFSHDAAQIMVILHSFAKPSSNNVLQPSLICGSGCNILSHSGLANVDTHKIMFYLLIDTVRVYV